MNLPPQIPISKTSVFLEFRLTWDFLGFLSSVLDNLAFCPLFDHLSNSEEEVLTGKWMGFAAA